MMLVDMVCCGLMWCDMVDRIEFKLLCLKQPFVLLRKMWTLTFAFEKRDYQTPPAHVPEAFGGLVIGQTKMIVLAMPARVRPCMTSMSFSALRNA